MMEAQRLNKEVGAKKRKLQETIERESRKDARMDDAMDGLDGSLVVMRVQTRILQKYPSVNNMRRRKNSGLSNAATDPVSLKVLSWNVLVWQKTVQTFSCRRFQCSQIGMCCCC